MSKRHIIRRILAAALVCIFCFSLTVFGDEGEVQTETSNAPMLGAISSGAVLSPDLSELSGPDAEKYMAISNKNGTKITDGNGVPQNTEIGSRWVSLIKKTEFIPEFVQKGERVADVKDENKKVDGSVCTSISVRNMINTPETPKYTTPDGNYFYPVVYFQIPENNGNTITALYDAGSRPSITYEFDSQYQLSLEVIAVKNWGTRPFFVSFDLDFPRINVGSAVCNTTNYEDQVPGSNILEYNETFVSVLVHSVLKTKVNGNWVALGDNGSGFYGKPLYQGILDIDHMQSFRRFNEPFQTKNAQEAFRLSDDASFDEDRSGTGLYNQIVRTDITGQNLSGSSFPGDIYSPITEDNKPIDNLYETSNIYAKTNNISTATGDYTLLGFRKNAGSSIEYYYEGLTIHYQADENGTVSRISNETYGDPDLADATYLADTRVEENVISGQNPVYGAIPVPNPGYRFTYWTADRDIGSANLAPGYQLSSGGTKIAAGSTKLSMEDIKHIKITDGKNGSADLNGLTLTAHFDTSILKVTNEIGDGVVTVRKKNVDGDPADEFTFDAEELSRNGTVKTFDGNGREQKSGAIEKNGSFSLKGGWYAKIALPAGTKYSFKERSAENYEAAGNPVTGTIADNRDFNYSMLLQEPKSGGGCSPLSGYSVRCRRSDGTESTLKTGTSGDISFKLKGGQSMEFLNIPTGVRYVLTQDTASDFTTIAGTQAGTSLAGTKGETPLETAAFQNSPKEKEQTVTNTYIPPILSNYTLSVKKSVSGNMGDKSKEFHFRLSLEGNEEAELTFTKGKSSGAVSLKNGFFDFTLAHGETISFKGILDETAYTVTETDADKDGYTTKVSGNASGTLSKDTEISFTNRKQAVVPTSVTLPLYGGLSLTGGAVLFLSLFLLKRKKQRTGM